MPKDENINEELNQEDSSDQIVSMENKVKELTDSLARAVAEQQNMRKRFERDSKEYSKYILNNFALSILEVIDNLELAMKASESDKNIHIGIQMVYKQILKTLEGKNITQIEIKYGDEFDSSKHEIIEEINSEQEKNKIEEVKTKGYLIDGHILRHAKVSVSNGTK